MLERVWRKGNPLTLLVGMQTSTATMENSVDIPCGEEGGKGGSGLGTHVHPWRMHVDVWQNQYNIVK